MPDKIVANIGPGEGPWVETRGSKNPRLEILGMKAGKITVILAEQLHKIMENPMEIVEAGLHQLPQSRYVKVCYHGSDKVICSLLL